MRQLMRRDVSFFAALVACAMFLVVIMTGCTLSGANPAPLTPVGDVGDGPTIPQPTATTDPGLVPTPTEAGSIDVFATQTAQAAVEPPAADATMTEDGDSELIIEPTSTADPSSEETPDVSEITATPDAEAPDGTEGPEPTEPAGDNGSAGTDTCIHVIEQGENLYRIALQYGVTYQELAEANGITNADSIKAGDELTIPGCEPSGDGSGAVADSGADGDDTVHMVQPGENLYRIALQYNTSWQVLAQYNGIDNPNALVVGQEIRIPAGD